MVYAWDNSIENLPKHFQPMTKVLIVHFTFHPPQTSGTSKAKFARFIHRCCEKRPHTIVILQQTENVYTIQNNNLKNTLLQNIRCKICRCRDSIGCNSICSGRLHILVHNSYKRCASLSCQKHDPVTPRPRRTSVTVQQQPAAPTRDPETGVSVLARIVG